MGDHQVGPRRQLTASVEVAGGLPNTSSHAVAHDGVADPTRHRERDRRSSADRVGRDERERSAAGPGSAVEAAERVTTADPVDQADRRWRPLRRRFLMIALPARVDMRCRKPCLRTRRRLLGWNVRFTSTPRNRGEPSVARTAPPLDAFGSRAPRSPGRTPGGVLRAGTLSPTKLEPIRPVAPDEPWDERPAGILALRRQTVPSATYGGLAPGSDHGERSSCGATDP